MKLKAALPVITLLLLGSLSADATTPRPFFLRTTVTLNGVEVPSGVYDLSWESEKTTVRVVFWKNGQFFASSQGKWVKNGVKYPNDAALLRVNSDGSRSLVEIRIKGIKKSIVLVGSEPTVQVGSK
jgi:hypothetical protein